jgi:hypothetical protein
LTKIYAEHLSAYVNHTSRLAFALDIPSDATPAFSVNAGTEGEKGGLEWKVRLGFLVAIPKRKHHSAEVDRGISLIPREEDSENKDNKVYSANSSLSPLVVSHDKLVELKCETVECEIPIRVLAGNTEFLVKPSIHVV